MNAQGWTVRQARWAVVVVMLVFLAPSTVFTVTGYPAGGGTSGHPLIAVALAGGIGAIHLRHALAVGRRPAGWRATFVVLIALVYVPILWWGWNWAAMQWFVIAAVAILLPGRIAVLVGVVPILGTVVPILMAATAGPGSPSIAAGGYAVGYWVSGLVLGGVALFGSSRLVGVIEDLHATRAELAAAAIGRERLRMSRDLHDLLGQSLSAVSLKGDLALALLRRDPPAARVEIESLTGVARDALRGIREVTRDEHTVSLRTECDGAIALLAAAGITTRIDIGSPHFGRDVDQLLGWAVREGVTNVLRHSEARTCSIRTRRLDGSVRLEITNDGAVSQTDTGTGLVGLADRAQALAGTVSVRSHDGQFRLTVDVPQELP